MITSAESLREIGLLPHQANFIIEFLSSPLPSHYLLIARPGQGRLAMVGVLIGQMVRGHQLERALFLTTHVEIERQISVILEKYAEGIPVIQIDAQSYRQVQISVKPGINPWSKPILAVGTIDFVKQEHIAENLAGVKWDLVVVDGLHQLVGLRRELLQRLVDLKALDRLMLLSDTMPRIDTFDFITGLQIIEWKPDVRDWDDNPLFTALREYKVVIYRRTEEEREFLDSLMGYLRQLRGSGASLQSHLLLRSASSSLYAIEQSLRKWRNRLAHEMPFNHAAIDGDFREKVSLEESSLESADLYAAIDTASEGSTADLQMLETLIEKLDRITSDTKLQMLTKLLDRLVSAGSASRICIFASFVTTASYIYSSLRDTRQDVHQIVGSMAYEERECVLQQFAESGGVLVVSSIGITGSDLNHADIGINYDLPSNPAEMARRWAWIDRPYRKSPCVMYAFKDESGSISLEERVLRLCGFVEKPQDIDSKL